MARKGKVGIEYFSHDVDMLNDLKVKLLKAKHGLVGYAVYIRLLEELYRDKGYYLTVNEDFNILFSDDNNLDYNEYILILNDCINQELFNKKLYEKYSILTSKRIQNNYLSATERRKEVLLIDKYLLIEKEDVNIKHQNVCILSLNDDSGTQSKKKVKRKESKLFEPPTLLQVEQYVLEKEYVINPKQFYDYYEALEWVNSKNKPIKSWKGTVVTWNNRELKQNPNSKPYKKKEIKKLARRDDY